MPVNTPERAPERALAAALREEPVAAAYLFGSRARGGAGPLSDVDVALLPEPGVGPLDRLALQARVSLAAAAAFAVDAADVVLLDEAPPAVAFEALKGRRILDRDPERRVRAEARIMSAYHDRRGRDARWERATLQRYLRGEFA